MNNDLIELPSGIIVSELAAEEYYRSKKSEVTKKKSQKRKKKPCLIELFKC